MNFVNLINSLNGAIWALPVILLILGTSIYYCIRMSFGTLRNWKLQFRLLFSGESSEEGISPLQTFCTVAAYRVAVGNVGGVAVAVMYGGPGALFWMLATSLLTSAIAYAENSLGQVYKVRQDGQYRGGSYNYIESGLGWKPVAVFYALLSLIAIPVFVVGPGANNIAMAFENSLGVSPIITGLVVGFLLFLVIAGGIRRIAKFSTIIVPIMTLIYFALTAVVLIVNYREIPGTLSMILGSAFSRDAIFGGLFGSAVVFGVKRAVNSSGAGMGESVPSAAAAESPHPAEQGLVNAFSVYIDVAVCLCTGSMIIITDCFNVLDKSGNFMHIGKGSSLMADQAATGTAGIVWVQEACNSIMPNIGGILVAFCLLFFAFSTTIAYYYEGESALAYLFRGEDTKERSMAIWVLRIVMPIMIVVWSTVTAGTAWAVSEVALGLLVWVNAIVLVFMSNEVITIYNDYMSQVKAGKKPYFNPQKLGIKNADLWMDINKDQIMNDKNNKKIL